MDNTQQQYFLGHTASGISAFQSALNKALRNIKTDINMNGHAIKNLKDPVDDQDASTKKYVDDTFVQGSGGITNLPSSLGRYQQVLPLDRDLDFTPSTNYNVLVKDTAVVANSKVVVNAGTLNTTRQGIVNTQNVDRANRIAEDAKLDQKINAEIANRETADTNLENMITTEVQQRQNADQEIQGDISDLQQQIDTINTNLSGKANQTALNAEITARQNGDTALDTALDAEILQRQNDVGNLQNQIDELGIADLASLQLNGIQTISGAQNFAWIKNLNDDRLTPVSVLTQAYNELETGLLLKLDQKAQCNPGATNNIIGGDLYMCSGFDVDGTEPMTKYNIDKLRYLNDPDTSYQPMQARQIEQLHYKKAETYNKLETDAQIQLAVADLQSDQINNADSSSSVKVNNDGTITLKLDNYDSTLYLEPNSEKLHIQPAGGLVFQTDNLSYQNQNVQILNQGQLTTKQYVDNAIMNAGLGGGGTTNQTLAEIQTSNPTETDVDLGNYTIKTSKTAVDLNDVPNLNYLQLNYLSADTPLNLITTPSNDVQFNNKKIISLADPTQDQDAVNKRYVSQNFLSTTTKLNDLAVDGDINLDVNKIQTSAVATLPNDIPNYNQIQLEFATIDTPLNLFGLPTSDLSVNGKKITNCAQPTLQNDVATKSYVDSSIGIQPTAQKYTETFTNLSATTVYTVTHNLAVQFSELDVQWWIQFKSAQNGFTTEWVDVSWIDRSAGTLTRNLQFQEILGNTNAFQFVTGADGLNCLNKTTGVHNGFTWTQINLKVIVTPITGSTKIVQSGQLASTIVWDQAVSSQFAINSTGSVTGDSSLMSRINCDGRYYSKLTDDLGTISQNKNTSANVSMNNNKITNLALCTNTNDGARKGYVDDLVFSSLQAYRPSIVQNAGGTVASVYGDTTIFQQGQLNANGSSFQFYDTNNSSFSGVNQLVKIFDTQGSTSSPFRYALSVGQNVSNGGRAMYANGAIQVSPSSNAGQNTGSTLLFIDGTIQTYGLNYVVPSQRDIKSYIGDPTVDFSALRFREFEYDQNKAQELGVSLPEGIKTGFIADEVPTKYTYVDERGIQVISQASLVQDICGWLLNERHKMRQELDDLKQRLIVLESR